MGNLTVLYYSASRETQGFEQNIIDTLIENTQLPIVSVTQKPTVLGKNICVGEHGNSYINEYRQILIGLEEIDTEYFISAEADFIYPEDYFWFEPKGENIYRSDSVWVLYGKGDFKRKEYSEGAQIAKVSFMKEFITHYLDGLPEWFPQRPVPSDAFYETYLAHQKELWRLPFTYFQTWPCISFKTKRGVNRGTSVTTDTSSYLRYWGTPEELRSRYYA